MRNFSNSTNSGSFIKSLIVGVISSVAMISVLICLLTVGLLSTSLFQHDTLMYIMLVIDAIGVFFGGYVAGRFKKSQGLVLGLLNGLIIFTALTLSGLSLSEETITIITLLKALVILIFSTLGAILGVNKKEKIHIK